MLQKTDHLQNKCQKTVTKSPVHTCPSTSANGQHSSHTQTGMSARHHKLEVPKQPTMLS
jgi:hypothetical protein